MSALVEVNVAELEELVATGETILADFYSNSCGPCKMLGIVLEGIANTTEDAKIVKVNFDNNKNDLDRFAVTMYPTMIIFKNGKEVKRLKGLQQKPLIMKALQE